MYFFIYFGYNDHHECREDIIYREYNMDVLLLVCVDYVLVFCAEIWREKRKLLAKLSAPFPKRVDGKTP